MRESLDAYKKCLGNIRVEHVQACVKTVWAWEGVLLSIGQICEKTQVCALSLNLPGLRLVCF